MKKIFFILLSGISLLFASCFGDNFQTYENAYGYVSSTASGVVFVNTSAGYSITWDGISDKLLPESCIKVSYKMDYSTLNDAYNVTDVSYTELTQCELSTDTPIIVEDTISALSISMYSSYLSFGDNWFVSIKTLRYPGLNANPKFYYSLDNIDNFDFSNNDSIIIDARVEFSGTRDSTKVNTIYVNTQEYVVDLSAIRSMLSVDSIPIYFRYYASKNSEPSYTTAKYILKSSNQ